MANTEDKDVLDKIIERLEKFNKNMDKALAWQNKGYTDEEYDEDYVAFFDLYSNMSVDELEKEKFLLECILQTKQKDENYNGEKFMISGFAFQVSAFLIL